MGLVKNQFINLGVYKNLMSGSISAFTVNKDMEAL
jgi:hypothetical protein